MMIPKTIHYCWFGGNSLPKSAQKCIASWKKFFPDYEIKEWNESNYDVNKIPYIKQAYEAKKYAFVSDYARFDILYQHGGVYFDTDVEVIKSFDDILQHGAFMGCEIDNSVSAKTSQVYKPYRESLVNPGLGIAANPKLQLYKEILNCYDGLNFILPNGKYNVSEAVVKITTEILTKNGFKNVNGIQRIANITIYPREYFNPFDDSTGRLVITENTHSIHWYSKTWMRKRDVFRSKLTRPFHRIFGDDCFSWLNR